MIKKIGFTLAEVLITLGIIGVVCTLTVPTLIQHYNTRAWSTAATVFDRKLEDALKTMNAQQTLAGHTSTESFVEELSSHFKTNKICNALFFTIYTILSLQQNYNFIFLCVFLTL